MCGLCLARVNETAAGGPPNPVSAPPAFQHRSSGRRRFWKSLIRENLVPVSKRQPLPPRGQGTARSLPGRVRAGGSSRGALPAWARRRNQQEVSIVSRPLTLANTDAEECNTQPRAVSVCIPYTSGARAGSTPNTTVSRKQSLCKTSAPAGTARAAPGAHVSRVRRVTASPGPETASPPAKPDPPAGARGWAPLSPAPTPRPGSGGRESETQRRQALETRVSPAVCAHAGPGAEAERRTGADRDAAPRCPASGGEAVVGAGAASPPGHRGPQPTARRPPLVGPGQSPVPARRLPHRRAGLARVPEPPSVCPVRACVCLRVCGCVCARAFTDTRVCVCVRTPVFLRELPPVRVCESRLVSEGASGLCSGSPRPAPASPLAPCGSAPAQRRRDGARRSVSRACI